MPKKRLGLEGVGRGAVHFKNCFCQGGGGGVQFSYIIIIFWGGKEGFNTPHFFGPSPGSATIAGLMLQMGESNVWWSVQICSVGAVVDLYLGVEGYSRQSHSNQITEELKRFE